MTIVLDDEEVLALVRPGPAVEHMRQALIAAYRGQLSAPARTWIELDSARFAITAGAHVDGPAGFRVYGGWGPGSDQLTAVWDSAGRLRGIVLGDSLGSARTGALGGVAVDVLARRESQQIGIIGTGTVAWWQVWAASAVRDFTVARVYSRSPQRRALFADRVTKTLGIAATSVESAELAVRESHVVLVSTTSRTPVLDPDWLAPGTHINSTGPKLVSGSEIPVELPAMADVVASDSPQQARDEQERWFSERGLDHLGGIAANELRGRTSDGDVTLFCSTGLAGTEVVLADALLREHRAT